MKDPFIYFFRDNFTPPYKQKNVALAAQKPRIEFIDLAKGVCILLVVMMHSGVGCEIPALPALRMPLYFMLSGLFFKDYGSFLNFTEKKINKILVPFIFFFFLGFVFHQLFAPLLGRELSFYAFREPFLRSDMNASNASIWFLICLFWVNLLYCIISISVRYLWLRALIVFLLGGTGYFLHLHQVYLPLFFASSLTALPFFFAGLLLRKFPLLYAGQYDRLGPLLGGLIIILIVCCCICCGTPWIDFRANFYHGNPLIIFPLSVSFVVGLLLVCKGIGWLPIVSYMGRYSIMVLGLHLFFLWFGYLTYVSPFVIFLLSSFFSWLLIPVCRAYLPHVTAQADWVRLPRRRKAGGGADGKQTVS